MSKFINYLNEQEKLSLSVINKSIHKDCKYYLSLVGNDLFTRGMKIKNSIGKKRVRQDRTPSGMDRFTFWELNKWLEKNGHLKRDNVLIANSITQPNTWFGANHYIFPIDKFSYTFIKVRDINTEDKRTGWSRFTVENYLSNPDVFDKESTLSSPFHTYFVTNKNIKIAHKNQYEIWFDCKEYYYASITHYNWNSTTKTLETRYLDRVKDVLKNYLKKGKI